MIKKCLGIKNGVRWLIKEFRNKKWSKRGVEDFLKRLRTTWSIERAPSSGRPRTTRTAENIDNRARRINHRHTTPLDRSHESSEYLKHQSCVYTTTYHWSASREGRHMSWRRRTKLLAFSVLGSCCSDSLTLMWITFSSLMRKFSLFRRHQTLRMTECTWLVPRERRMSRRHGCCVLAYTVILSIWLTTWIFSVRYATCLWELTVLCGIAGYYSN